MTNKEKLRKLLIICTYNIKGHTKQEKLNECLPLKVKNMDIYEEDNRIVFKQEGKVIDEVWKDVDSYENLEILKNITPLFSIKCSGDGILELMKYRNNIIVGLL